jgi:hypothetical protein
MLRVSTISSFGSVTFENPGDVPVAPFWTVKGPFSSFIFTSPAGEIVHYNASALITDTIYIDMLAGTVEDQSGVNKYDKLVGIPDFWEIPPGVSTGTIQVNDATVDTKATAIWNPRKWVLF